jgi:hypothetical protein
MQYYYYVILYALNIYISMKCNFKIFYMKNIAYFLLFSTFDNNKFIILFYYIFFFFETSNGTQNLIFQYF